MINLFPISHTRTNRPDPIDPSDSSAQAGPSDQAAGSSDIQNINDKLRSFIFRHSRDKEEPKGDHKIYDKEDCENDKSRNMLKLEAWEGKMLAVFQSTKLLPQTPSETQTIIRIAIAQIIWAINEELQSLQNDLDNRNFIKQHKTSKQLWDYDHTPIFWEESGCWLSSRFPRREVLKNRYHSLQRRIHQADLAHVARSGTSTFFTYTVNGKRITGRPTYTTVDDCTQALNNLKPKLPGPLWWLRIKKAFSFLENEPPPPSQYSILGYPEPPERPLPPLRIVSRRNIYLPDGQGGQFTVPCQTPIYG